MQGHWRLGFNCYLQIGSYSSSTNPVYMTIAEGTKVVIGEDCMFATNNQIRTDDAHPIYDSLSGQRVNLAKDIYIGNHVWIAFGATIMGGAKIGDGSIVGAYALAKKTYPNNCIIAGTPARVIRRNIFWERNNLLNTDRDLGFLPEEIESKPYAAVTYDE